MNSPDPLWTTEDTITIAIELVMSFFHGVLYLTMITLGIVALLGLSTCETEDMDNDDWTVDQGDCDDMDEKINPAAAELCDELDNDCDGEIDEGFDQDQDGFTSCTGDCDDSDPNTYPGAPEVQDTKDNDCDGTGDTCCKVCTSGLACGDTCIDPTETCTEAPGCACQGEL